MNLVYNFLISLIGFLSMAFLCLLITLATLKSSLYPILKHCFNMSLTYTFKSILLNPCNIVKNINDAFKADLKGFSMVSTLATIQKQKLATVKLSILMAFC